MQELPATLQHKCWSMKCYWPNNLKQQGSNRKLQARREPVKKSSKEQLTAEV